MSTNRVRVNQWDVTCTVTFADGVMTRTYRIDTPSEMTAVERAAAILGYELDAMGPKYCSGLSFKPVRVEGRPTARVHMSRIGECSEPNCHDPIHAHGECAVHYRAGLADH